MGAIQGSLPKGMMPELSLAVQTKVLKLAKGQDDMPI
jgi:hypothetical protein